MLFFPNRLVLSYDGNSLLGISYAVMILVFFVFNFKTNEVQAAASNLDDLMQEASKSHPVVAAKKAEYRASLQSLSVAEWSRFPSLSAEFRPLGSNITYTGIRLDQPIWTWGRISGQINVALANSEMANASTLNAQMGVMLDVASAYYDVLRYQAKLDFALQNESEHVKFLSSMRRRVDAGVSPETDFNQTSVRLRQATNERIQVERQLINARLLLNKAVGRDVGDITKPNSVILGDLSEDILINEAREFSPERKGLIAKIQMADSEIIVAKSKLLPQLSLGYMHQFGNVPAGIGQDLAFLSLQYQTGSGLANYSAIQEMIEKKHVAEEGLKSFDLELIQQLRTFWMDYKSLTDQYKQVTGSMIISKSVVDSYLRQFRVGKKSWIDVLNSQKDRLSTQYAVVDVEAPMQFAALKLLLISGRIKAGDLVTN